MGLVAAFHPDVVWSWPDSGCLGVAEEVTVGTALSGSGAVLPEGFAGGGLTLDFAAEAGADGAGATVFGSPVGGAGEADAAGAAAAGAVGA